MGRMSDLHIDLINLEQSWIDFLNDLFSRDGWEVTTPEPGEVSRFRLNPDMIVSQRGEHQLIELKLSRSPRASRVMVHNAISSLRRMLENYQGYTGILIIPQPLTAETKAAFEADSGGSIRLWDLPVLARQAMLHPDLAGRLADLLRALQVGAEDAPSVPTPLAMLQNAEESPPAGEGVRLADAFGTIKPGRKKGAAQAFEKLCEEALMLLFGTELLGWRSQSQIEQGYQRVDLIARIQPSKSAFWQTLVTDFRARYVVFEFKNYTHAIGQDQIYSTERYLFATALRSVAIVIARQGYDKNANRTVQGALREQGKLILCITLSELQQMLRDFDSGDEYEGILLARRDDLLMSLAR